MWHFRLKTGLPFKPFSKKDLKMVSEAFVPEEADAAILQDEQITPVDDSATEILALLELELGAMIHQLERAPPIRIQVNRLRLRPSAPSPGLLLRPHAPRGPGAARTPGMAWPRRRHKASLRGDRCATEGGILYN
jgi:hypothetical protein